MDEFYLSKLNFVSNSAQKGGAIFVADDASDMCKGSKREVFLMECFIQTLAVYLFYSDNDVAELHISKPKVFINTFFFNNSAHLSGSDIYGGLLDRCTVSPFAELLLAASQDHSILGHSSLDLIGFDYIKATAQIEHATDYSLNSMFPGHLISGISRSDVKGLISSDPLQVMFCVNGFISPDYLHPVVSIKKGERFAVTVVAVDQVGNPVNATVVSFFFSSSSGNGHIKDDQIVRQVGSECTVLEYNVYSQDELAHIQIHAEGLCDYLGISTKRLSIAFLPCTCPVGFQQSPSDDECVCDCDQVLKHYQITICFADNETIVVEGNAWLDLIDFPNDTGLVIHGCPFDYCVQKPVYISLNNSDLVNAQCAYNRTGILAMWNV